jgi:hypothetical protein
VTDDAGRMAYSAPKTHYCNADKHAGSRNIGDVWQCGGCGAYWRYRLIINDVGEWNELRGVRLLRWKRRMRKQNRADSGPKLLG